jgi:hypothetical protein
MASGVDAGKEREPAAGNADAGAGGGESSVGVFQNNRLPFSVAKTFSCENKHIFLIKKEHA